MISGGPADEIGKARKAIVGWKRKGGARQDWSLDTVQSLWLTGHRKSPFSPAKIQH